MTPSKGALAVPYYAETEEEQAKLQELQSARQKLQEALEGRNRLFDPVLLAMAQGFLSPTPTGKFGESLANVAKAVAPAQEAEEKRGREIAQMRAELAAMELGQLQEARTRQEFKKLLGGSPTTSTGEQPASSDEAFAAIKNLPSDQAIATLALTDPNRAKILSDMKKSIMERFKVTERGVFDVEKGRFTPRPGGPVTPVYIPEVGGSLPLTERDQVELDAARRSGNNEEVYKIIKRLTSALPRPDEGVQGEPSAAITSPVQLNMPTTSATAQTRPLAVTVEQRAEQEKEKAAQLEIKKAAEIEFVKEAAKRSSAVIEQGNAARQQEPNLQRIEVILQRPGMDRVLAVLERNGALEAVGSLVEEAFRVGNTSVGIPAIRKILTNYNTPQNLINSAAELMSAYATLNFDARKGLGSGTSVSNFEQQMVNQMGLSMADTVATANAKLKFLRDQSKFRQDLSASFKDFRKNNPYAQYDDFEQTTQFQNMFAKYMEQQKQNVSTTAEQPSRPAAQAATPKLIQGRTGAWERQPDGSLKAKRN